MGRGVDAWGSAAHQNRAHTAAAQAATTTNLSTTHNTTLHLNPPRTTATKPTNHPLPPTTTPHKPQPLRRARPRLGGLQRRPAVRVGGAGAVQHGGGLFVGGAGGRIPRDLPERCRAGLKKGFIGGRARKPVLCKVSRRSTSSFCRGLAAAASKGRTEARAARAGGGRRATPLAAGNKSSCTPLYQGPLLFHDHDLVLDISIDMMAVPI